MMNIDLLGFLFWQHAGCPEGSNESSCHRKVLFNSNSKIQGKHPDLQPAPRARLLSLCTVTLESFRVSLSMALRRPEYSDWSIGYMPEGQKKKQTECTSAISNTLH